MLIRQQMQLACQSLLLVHGAGAKQFLQGLITKDMESLNSVPLVYSFLLNVRGRILADFFIYRLDGSDDETFVLETARERVGLLEKALRLYRLRKQIGIEPLLDKSVHFGIPAEAEEGAQKNSASVSTDWLADPRVPGFGFRSIRKTASEMQSDEKASASSAYLRHRLAWGLAEGEEMADQIPLNMNGDITGGVSFEKGCYIGQELVARTHFTGIVRRRLMPFQPIDRDVSRDGFLVDERGKRQGKIICSHAVSRCPSLRFHRRLRRCPSSQMVATSQLTKEFDDERTEFFDLEPARPTLLKRNSLCQTTIYKMEGNEPKSDVEPTEEEGEEDLGRKARVNKFAVAFLDMEDNGPRSSSTGSENEENSTNEKPQTQAKKGGKPKKRKRAKKRPKTGEDEQFLDEFVRELSISKPSSSASAGQQQLLDTSVTLETLLKIDSRCLDPDAELRRLLGRTFGAAEQRRAQQRRLPPQLGGGRLTKARADWPPPRQIGFYLAIDDEKKEIAENGEQQIQWFRFCHNEQYQNQQQLFWMCQRQMDHEGILNDILPQNPYHLDSLLTLAEVLNVQEDFQRARDAIERGIFASESVFHSNFQPFSPLHRLDYGCRENRAFFLLLHRHMLNQIQRRCFQTAFQFGKMIFAKDPWGDPLGLLLLIDLLAIKGRSPEFLLNFFDHYKEKRRLDLLPNFLFSLPLAHLALCANESDAKIKLEHEKKAEKCLEEALLRFPFVLAQLLDRLQVQPDSVVDFNAYLSSTAIYREPVGSRLLAHIYVHHSAEELWRANLAWLERATHLALPRLTARRAEMDEWAQKRKRCFVGLPQNVVRHCILHGIRPSDTQLAQLLDDQIGPNMVADPCPPSDTRRQRYDPANLDELLQLHGINMGLEGGSGEDGTQPGILGAFLRTLLPDQEQARLELLLQTVRQRFGTDGGRGGGGTQTEEAAPAAATEEERRRHDDGRNDENEQ
uniref:Aminomethyltransferase folate-binding domain-containing protein n=1 Tax=Globodera rostochiensis TaxID=31243 RepID=A0A914HQH4_GLORO